MSEVCLLREKLDPLERDVSNLLGNIRFYSKSEASAVFVFAYAFAHVKNAEPETVSHPGCRSFVVLG